MGSRLPGAISMDLNSGSTNTARPKKTRKGVQSTTEEDEEIPKSMTPETSTDVGLTQLVSLVGIGFDLFLAAKLTSSGTDVSDTMSAGDTTDIPSSRSLLSR
jgi:hypothetical protein